MTTTKTVSDILKTYGACEDAIEWARGYKSKAKAWRECPRGDWLLWIIARATDIGEPWSDQRKPLVACCLDCAETVSLLRNKSQAKKIAAAVTVVRQWIDGKATAEQAKQAQLDLFAAAYVAGAYADNVAYAAAAATAANVAGSADAFDAADCAATAANAASADAFDAADCAATAANAAYYADAARTQNQASTAAIVRRHYPKPPRGKR